MRKLKLVATALLAGLILLPATQASAAMPRGGGGGPVMVSTGRLGMVKLASQHGSTVSGAAFLAYDAQAKKMSVIIEVSGLTPNSVHPEHIHKGASCAANGPVLYPLPNLVANSKGVAIQTATIDLPSVPATGLYLNVHQGPGLVGAQFTPIACGMVRRPNDGAALAPQHGTKVEGLVLMASNMATSTTDVVAVVTGLAPNSVHPEHIHKGASCDANGPVLYPLPNLVADDSGVAVSATTLGVGSLPATGLYVNVHRGPGLVGAQFTPIACGVVQRTM